MKKVIVVGGGIGGLVTAKKIRRKIPPEDKVILIDKKKIQYFYPMLLWLIIGERKEKDIYRSLTNLPSDLEYIYEDVIEILPHKKTIITNNSKLTYDILVIATGSEYDYQAFPKLIKAGYNLYDIEGTTDLKKALTSFKEGNIAILVSSLPFKCPPAVYEAALLLNTLLKKRGLKNKFKITIYTPDKTPLKKYLGPTFDKVVNQILSEQGIRVETNCSFKSVNSDKKILKFNEFNVNFDLLIFTPSHRGSTVIRNSGLGDDKGWLHVNSKYLYLSDDIFVLGDAAAINIPSGSYLIKSGAVATFQSKIVSQNVASVLKGKFPQKTFKGYASCVIDIGNGNTLLSLGNFYAEKHPAFTVLPKSKIWRFGKRVIEYMWLKEGAQV